jgi:hypothetical protein
MYNFYVGFVFLSCIVGCPSPGVRCYALRYRSYSWKQTKTISIFTRGLSICVIILLTAKMIAEDEDSAWGVRNSLQN